MKLPNIIQKWWGVDKSLEKRSTNDANVNLTAAKSPFGSIAGINTGWMGNFDFVPRDGNGNTISLTGDEINVDAVWLGLSSKNMQFWAYNYCSPLAAVIDRLAEADTNGRIEFFNEDGTTYKNPSKNPALNRIKKLIRRPNPFQTWDEFNYEQVLLSKIFGYCPVFALGPAGMDKTWTKCLINLNPFFWTPERNWDFNLMDSKGKGKIKQWIASFGGRSYTIPAEDVILVKDGMLDKVDNDLGLPLSKIAGLDYCVSNICAAMEADNVLLKKKGPLGIFSHDPKPDMAGWVPMNPDEKTELQQDLGRYGLTFGQLQYVISKTPIKWNAMSFNLRDLMTKETVRQGIDGICDRFGYPAELMSGKNATYENRNSAEKYLYQNNIIPFSLRRMARYTEFFDLQNGIYLGLDYDHLPVLQEDILNAGQAAKSEAEALDIEWKSGLITWNEWRQAKDRDTVAGMDIYYPEWAKKNGIDLNPVKEKSENKENDTPPKNTGAKK